MDFQVVDLHRILCQVNPDVVSQAVDLYFNTCAGEAHLVEQTSFNIKKIDEIINRDAPDAGRWVVEAYANQIGIGKPATFVLDIMDNLSVKFRTAVLQGIAVIAPQTPPPRRGPPPR